MKKIYMYAVVMIIFALAIVLVVGLSENKIDNYEEMLTMGKSEIERLENRVAELESENYELKNKTEQTLTVQSNFDTQIQIMNDLTEIYKLKKRGKDAEAEAAFLKIDTVGFDDSALAFYESIKIVLGK